MADETLTSGTEEKAIVHDDAPVHADTHGDPALNPAEGHTETSPPKTDDVVQGLVAQAGGSAAVAPVVTQPNVLTGAAPQGDTHTKGGTGDPKVVHSGIDGAVAATQKHAKDLCKPWNRGAPGGDTLGATGSEGEAPAQTDPTEMMIQGATDNAVDEMKSNPTADTEGGSETGGKEGDSESEMP